MSRREVWKSFLDYKGMSIEVSTSTGRFRVEQLSSGDPFDTLDAAKRAIAKTVKKQNAVARQPVIVLNDYYSMEPEESTFAHGQLTSARAEHGGGRAFVTVGEENEQFDVEKVYLDTPENRTLAARVDAIRAEVAKLETEKESIIEKKMKRPALPGLEKK